MSVNVHRCLIRILPISNSHISYPSPVFLLRRSLAETSIQSKDCELQLQQGISKLKWNSVDFQWAAFAQ